MLIYTHFIHSVLHIMEWNQDGFVPPDGGYGWIIVIAFVVINVSTYYKLVFTVYELTKIMPLFVAVMSTKLDTMFWNYLSQPI